LADARNEPYKLVLFAIDNTLCGEAFGLPGYNTREQTILIYVKDPNVSGIKESSSYDLKIYPLPASSKVYAEIPERSIRKITLIDMTGKSISPGYSYTNGKLEIDLGSLRTGTYLLQAISDQNVYSGKVIVTR
jgi:hypothetical protein